VPPKKTKTDTAPVEAVVRGEIYRLDRNDPNYWGKLAVCAAIEARQGTVDRFLLGTGEELLDMDGARIWPR